MDRSLEDNSSTTVSGHDCGFFSDGNIPNSSYIKFPRNKDSRPCRKCHAAEPSNASRCWPSPGNSNFSEVVSGIQVPIPTVFTTSKSLHKLGQLLPDTQRNRTNSQIASENTNPVLHQLNGSLPDTQLNVFESPGKSMPTTFEIHSALPDTQRNVLDYEDVLMDPRVKADFQLPDTQRNVLEFAANSVELKTDLLEALPESQTQLLDHGYDQDTAPDPNSPLPDTQVYGCAQRGISQRARSELSSLLPATQRNEILSALVKNTIEVQSRNYLSDTQSNAQPLRPHLLSPGIPARPTYSNMSLRDQEILLQDTQRIMDAPDAPHPIVGAASKHPQNSNSPTSSQMPSISDSEVLASAAMQPPLKASSDSNSSESFPPKAPYNKTTCRERKRIIVSPNRPPALTKAMCQWVDKTNYLLDPFRDDDECWFHPSPPPARLATNGILRPCGKLQKRFNWKDRIGKHSLMLNFGIASKLVNYKMTKQQKDGFINKQWHLSHLCGNWTCLNPAHTTVEPGNVNISRNNCFSHRSGCLHNPVCLKDKKVPLGADGKLVDHSTSMYSQIDPVDGGDWDEWSVLGFADGDESMLMDNNEDLEVAGSTYEGDSFINVEDDDEL
jgi:Zinc-binding loop region of homing endonuclease